MLKVSLISLPCFHIEDDSLEQNLGLGYIAACLQRSGIDVSVHEYTGCDPDEFSKALDEPEPADIYGISFLSPNISNARRMIEAIKKQDKHAYIVAGGVHASALPEETLRNLRPDAVITGEGELAFLDIVRKFEEHDPLYGIIEGRVVTDLDFLPFPSRELVDQSRYTRRLDGSPAISMISSRGCMFSCLHCNSIIMGGRSRGVRYRGVKNIIDEIRYLKNDLGFEAIRFNDDSFTDNKNIDALIEAIGKTDIKYRIFSRLDMLPEHRIKALAQSGCKLVSVGIESVNEDNLKFLRKNAMPYEVLELTSKYGLKTRASFMVGLPFDSYESIERDFKLAAAMPFDEFAVYALIPYPGTPIWDSPEKYGYTIENREYENYIQMGFDKHSAAAMSHFSPETGYAFSPEDVSEWISIANEILGGSKLHMKNSPIAQ